MSIILGQEPRQLVLEEKLMVDLCFPVQGSLLPADHGYGLLAALAHLVPSLHQNPHVGILTAPGIRDGKGKILLTPRSQVRIRLPIEAVAGVYGLAGKCLRVGCHEVRLGIPQLFTLKPSSALKARIVTIKGYQEAEAFEAAAQRQLKQLGFSGKVSVMRDQQGNPLRKTLKIKQHTMVGFTTLVQDLGEEESIRLQQIGLGGRRRMGCGFFLPCR